MRIESMTRMCIEELPYIKSFVKYHLDQGVDKMYLINTSHDSHDEVVDYLREFGDEIELLKFDSFEGGKQLKPIRENLHKLTPGSWFIHLDADEYLVPPDKNIRAFFDRQEKSDLNKQLRFTWWTVSNDTNNQLVNMDGVNQFPGRYAIPVDIIPNNVLRGLCHEIENVPTSMCNKVRLLHFNTRSFNDALLKVRDRKLFYNTLPQKEMPTDQVINWVKSGKLPKRLRLLAYINLLEKNTFSEKINKNISTMDIPLKIDYQMENKILDDKWNSEDIQKIKVLYNEFKNKIPKELLKKGKSNLEVAEVLEKI
jgi:hypothetical protein